MKKQSGYSSIRGNSIVSAAVQQSWRTHCVSFASFARLLASPSWGRGHAASPSIGKTTAGNSSTENLFSIRWYRWLLPIPDLSWWESAVQVDHRSTFLPQKCVPKGRHRSVKELRSAHDWPFDSKLAISATPLCAPVHQSVGQNAGDRVRSQSSNRA